MRYKNEKGDIRIYAVAGTQTVLLSFDIDKAKVNNKNFLGFDIERKHGSDKPIKLNGSKYFKSLIEDSSVTDPKLKYVSLVQSYFWKDYLADPGETYEYTFNAMFGNPHSFKSLYTGTIKVTTEELYTDEHSVFFNYGVTGSQAFSRKFKGNEKVLLEEKPEDVYKKAVDFLGRELWSSGLTEFVNRAKNSDYSLYCAFYEFEYPGFMEAIKNAVKRKVKVEVVYSAQPDQKKDNVKGIKEAGIKEGLSHPRTKANQPHNKFMILCKNNKPAEVWTGSTNITLSGIFGHSNTGHWVKNKDIAEKYMKYWEKLKDNPALPELAEVSEQIQPDCDLKKLKKGTYVFFSPRKTDAHLYNYSDLINNAAELVCMIFPFNIEDTFKKVFREDKNYLRFVLFEKQSASVSVKSNDRDLMITAGAVLDDPEKYPVEQWVKEVTSTKTAKAGIRYVHNKFFLIDALSDMPVVISGSANFSDESIKVNDENTLVIKGDTRAADIYLTEFNRLFEHFWPRYLRKLNKNKKQKTKKGFDKPLDEKYEWFYDYYTKGKLGLNRKNLFINMKKTKQG